MSGPGRSGPVCVRRGGRVRSAAARSARRPPRHVVGAAAALVDGRRRSPAQRGFHSTCCGSKLLEKSPPQRKPRPSRSGPSTAASARLRRARPTGSCPRRTGRPQRSVGVAADAPRPPRARAPVRHIRWLTVEKWVMRSPSPAASMAVTAVTNAGRARSCTSTMQARSWSRHRSHTANDDGSRRGARTIPLQVTDPVDASRISQVPRRRSAAASALASRNCWALRTANQPSDPTISTAISAAPVRDAARAAPVGPPPAAAARSGTSGTGA